MEKPGQLIVVADTRLQPTHFLAGKENLLYHDPNTGTIEPLAVLEEAKMFINGNNEPMSEEQVLGTPREKAHLIMQHFGPGVLENILATRTNLAKRLDLSILINTLGGANWTDGFIGKLSKYVATRGGSTHTFITTNAVSAGFTSAIHGQHWHLHKEAQIVHHIGSMSAYTRKAMIEKEGEEEAMKRIERLTGIMRKKYEERKDVLLSRLTGKTRYDIAKRFDDALKQKDGDRWVAMSAEELFDGCAADSLHQNTDDLATEFSYTTGIRPDAARSVDQFFRISRAEGYLRRAFGIPPSNISFDKNGRPVLLPHKTAGDQWDHLQLLASQLEESVFRDLRRGKPSSDHLPPQ
jgi:hypothetical protein